MASYDLRDQDRLDSVSNFAIWKAKILSILEEHDVREHIENVVAVPVDANALQKLNKNQARAKRLIMDGVKDHVVPHIVEKKTTNEVWTTLTTLCQGSSVQCKMYLENQMRMFQMHKGEEIDLLLPRLQTIWDQLISLGSTTNEGLLVRTTLNVVTDEWETFVQSILGRAQLPNWGDMWAILRQEEI